MGLRRAMAAVGLASVVALAIATPAGAKAKVGPDQYFTGVIDGTDGNTANPITIQMACFGPLQPGETGHPLAGQTLAVHQLFPPTAGGSIGTTGDDSEIGVFFGTPPPSSTDVGRSTVFTHYDKTKPLPTKLTLPCSGSGTVWFVPIPVVPPSQSAAVTVEYASQP